MATLKAYFRALYETDLSTLPDEIKTGTRDFEVSMDGDDYISGRTQEIGLSEEQVDLSDLTNPFVFIKNLDTGNFVEVGLTGSYPIKLKPKEFCCFRTNGTIYAKADTAACVVEIMAFEE